MVWIKGHFRLGVVSAFGELTIDSVVGTRSGARTLSASYRIRCM